MLFDSGCVVCKAVAGPVCARCAGQLRMAGHVFIDGVDVCRAGFMLDEHARTIIAAFKYHRQRRLARWLAGRIADQIPRGADAIAWVPATPERRKSRGFDQAQELARALSAITEVPCRRLLLRRRNDERQTGRSRAERVAGPGLSSGGAAPRFVVLVDDVVTTGSSMRTAAVVLRSAGTERIVGVAAAAKGWQQDCCLPPPANGSIIRTWT